MLSARVPIEWLERLDAYRKKFEKESPSLDGMPLHQAEVIRRLLIAGMDAVGEP